MKPVKELLEFCFINIDKPTGPTSHQVSDYVRESLGLRKTSHMGTLDPGVSGVLPIACNRACKLATFLLGEDKSYVGIGRLHEDVSEKKLEEAIKAFVGTIKQKPPVRSNVKRVVRERAVYTFNVLEKEGSDFLFETSVQGGTYIRTLIHDVGKNLGGAHMLELRRTRAGTFNEKESHTLHAFDAAIKALNNGNEKALRTLLISAEDVINAMFPCVLVKKDRLQQILTGKPVHAVDLVKKISLERGTTVAVFCNEQFVEIARVVNEGDVIATPLFVYN